MTLMTRYYETLLTLLTSIHNFSATLQLCQNGQRTDKYSAVSMNGCLEEKSVDACILY